MSVRISGAFNGQRRLLSLFGNIGGSMKKIVPKDHVYFKVKRPVGLKEKPKHLSKVSKGKHLTKEDLNIPRKIWNFYFDGVTRKTRVSKIEKEMAYGGMYDFHVYNKTKGRLFAAPPSYFKREKALYFPNFAVRSLANDQKELLDLVAGSKATILRVFSTRTGEEMTKEYFKVPDSEESYLADLGIDQLKQSYPDAQILQLMLSDSWIKYLLHVYVSGPKLRQLVPESLHERFLFAMRDDVLSMEDRERLLMTNLYSGYVYVLDNSSRIRWVGSGWPEGDEVTKMWNAVRGVSREVNMSKTNC
ncbi:hypothetical protein HII12_002725 [Brettanomyces bruxellensis]|uniref:Mitochondrial ATPase complex subunit ATP10 n=1 Tax=Dekkera bruxellensis TaxID=5007 RepID=A0A8H6BG15_DEKBR|nr:hypothetical protein HII12_002725 [Brettanomyces bruxellensis]